MNNTEVAFHCEDAAAWYINHRPVMESNTMSIECSNEMGSCSDTLKLIANRNDENNSNNVTLIQCFDYYYVPFALLVIAGK